MDSAHDLSKFSAFCSFVFELSHSLQTWQGWRMYERIVGKRISSRQTPAVLPISGWMSDNCLKKSQNMGGWKDCVFCGPDGVSR